MDLQGRNTPMQRYGQFGLVLSLLLLASGLTICSIRQPLPATHAAEPAPLSPEEERERQIQERFLGILEKNPRRGTALDRVYGYHVERGSLDALVGQFTARTRKNPGDGTAWMILGLLESQRGRDAQAVTAFRQAETQAKENALASYYLGQSLVLIGQPDAAAEAFERAIARKPARADLLDAFQALGRVYQLTQRSEKALAVWNRLEQLFPDDLRVQEQIAATLAEESQFEQALPRYEKLARATKDLYQQAIFRMEAAELKVRLKQTAKGLADFEEMLGNLNPDNWLYREVRRKIEEVFLRTDDLAGLAKYYEGWLQKNPADVEVMGRLARTLTTQGRLPEARTVLEKAIARAPKRRDLRQGLIDQLVFEQKYADAAVQFEAMDKADPGNPDTLRDWGKLLMQDSSRPEAERKQAASAVWKRLLEKRPKDPVITVQVADLMRSANLTEEAIALYQKAVELAPTALQYREYLGEFYHSLKRTPEALEAWKPIAAGPNRNAKNLTRLGEVLNGFGYRQESLLAFADALTLDRDDFNLLLRYAELLHQDGKYDETLKQLDAAARLISNAEEAEAVLLAQIKTYQANETLASRTEALQKELEAGKEPTGERWHRLARYYEASRQLAEATEAIRKALEKEPRAIPILASAARIHEAAGNLLLAADTNRQLAAVDRRLRTEYLTAVAKLEAQLGRRAQALQAGRDLLAAAPGNPDHYKFYADLCFQLGEGVEGLEALRRSVRANPSEPQGLLTLANALAERFQTGEAIELLWRAFDKTTELEGKLGIIGRLTELYLQTNQLDRLLERLERERREADKQREMTLCLGQVYQSAGDLGTARQQLERLLSENARDTQLLGQLASLAESEGDVAVALKHLRQLEKAAPTDRDVQLRLAQLLVRAGESDEATAIWVKLAGSEPEPHRTLSAIDSLLTNGKQDTALAITTRLLTQQPGNWELLYREGAALAALHRPDEAGRRFEAILALRLNDDEPGAETKARTKSSKNRKAGTAVGRVFLPEGPPVQERLQAVYAVRAAVGLDPRQRYYGSGGQRQTWTPKDFGQARLGALGWLYSLAQKQNQGDVLLRRFKPAAEKNDSRAAWDWYYLQRLRQDFQVSLEAARALAEGKDPAGPWVFLMGLAERTAESGRRYYRRQDVNEEKDLTPPLPAPQIESMLTHYRRLCQQKPMWAGSVLPNILTELKRAKRTQQEEQLYREALATATQIPDVQQMLGIASGRGDQESVLQLFARLEQLQGGAGPAGRSHSLTREAVDSLTQTMSKRADARAHADLPRLFEVYQASQRRQRVAGARSTTGSLSPYGNQNYFQFQLGKNWRGISLDFPQPNEYFDRGAIQLLLAAYELYKRDDLVSDLLAHFRRRLASPSHQPGEALDLHLALAYLHWWSSDKEEAVAELTAASNLVPGDANLRLELADLWERTNERTEALAILDRITPLDHTTMQRREIAALRLAVRTGNVDRAREAADRLFGLRLNTETQVQLAAQMHQLGMHGQAQTVLARAQRQAGNRTTALVSLMHQYQSQNQPDLAVQTARQLLRKGPSTQFTPYYNRAQNDDKQARTQAIQVLARSGQLKEMIERAEAQLKSSPRSVQLCQALIDYYTAANDRDKAKAMTQRMAQIRPDDAGLRFQVAQQMSRWNDHAAACEHYLAALRKDPVLFTYQYWQIQQTFRQAKKYDELVKFFDEIDLRSVGGNYWAFIQMLQPLLDTEESRVQGLKLFRKVWEAFPEERAGLMGQLHQDEVWQLPEIYDYARQAVFPGKEGTLQPWKGGEEIMSWGGEGRVTGLVTQILSAARRQNRLDALTHEIERALKQRPGWKTGQALLAVIDIQRGRTDRARHALKELLDDRETPMPPMARIIFGQEMENYGAVADLVLRAYEEGVEESLKDSDMEFEYHPVRRLVALYREAGRKTEARALMLKCLRTVSEDYDPGYATYRRFSSHNAIASELLNMGYPVDAVRIYNELLADKEAPEHLSRFGGPEYIEMAAQGMKRALTRIKPEILPGTVRDLLEPRPASRERQRPDEEALDLVLVVQPRELHQATLTSMLATAFRSTAGKPEVQEEMRQRLARLVPTHPRDFSVQIAAALAALGEKRPDQVGPAVDRLVKLVEATPLEPLPPGKRANARQRTEAARQIGLWLVARLCLERKELRAVGVQLGERAVEAASRQLDYDMALAMLREWGQLELDRGDRQAAEQRWKQMLRLVLPVPVSPRRQDSSRTGASNRSPSTEYSVLSTQYSVLSTQTSRPPQVPVVTVQQFEQAAQVAALAVEKGLTTLSLQAMREALRGGPPVRVVVEDPRFRQSNPGNQATSLTGLDDSGSAAVVAGHLRDLAVRWRQRQVPPADLYDLLVEIVLPETRPAEVFLYPQMVRFTPGERPVSAARLLAEAAAQANRLDDLRQRIAARQDKPLAELSARVLLAQAALAARDQARSTELLQTLGERLQKDTVQNTAQMIAHVAWPALFQAGLEPSALPVVERIAANLVAAGADGPGTNLLLALGRYHLEHGRQGGGSARQAEQWGRARLKRVVEIALRNEQRQARAPLNQNLQQAVREYSRAGLLPEALELLGMAADQGKPGVAWPSDAAALFARHFAGRPAQERYDLMKNWSFPTAGRKSVRVLVAFIPTDTPPPAFGTFAAPASGVLSTVDLLVSAAREANKLDELAGEAKQLADQKIENGLLLYQLVQIARGQAPAIEESIKQTVTAVRQKLAQPARPSQPRRYYYGDEPDTPQVPWAEYLLTRACLADAKLASQGRPLAGIVRPAAQRAGIPELQKFLHHDEGRSKLNPGSTPEPQPNLALWHAFSRPNRRANGQTGPDAWWVVHEGHLGHLGGRGDDFLLLNLPLRGTFEFSVDTCTGVPAVGYGGLVFQGANPPLVWTIGKHEQIQRTREQGPARSFDRCTIQVEPNRFRLLINGQLFYEEKDPAPTSPWLALFSGGAQHTEFHNVTLRGSPEIPREVPLTHGNRLEGWEASFFNESQPPHLSRNQAHEEEEEDDAPNRGYYRGSRNQPVRLGLSPVYDWSARDGEIHGRRNGDPDTTTPLPSLLTYFRPLRSGETLRYEFFCKPPHPQPLSPKGRGENEAVMVHPSLGQLAFLLEPDRVRLHWLSGGDLDWTGLALDNAVDEPALKQTGKPLPLRPNAWNTMRIIVDDNAVKMELNGEVICVRKLEATNDRVFGLFHYKDRTSAQVRNVVLTGNWPEKLVPAAMADLLVPADTRKNNPALRQVIGERNYIQDAGLVLEQTQSLPPEQRYARLLAWVFPTPEHPAFQLSGEFGPTNPVQDAAPAPSAGARLQTGGTFQAPILELVALARKLGKLDELSQRLESAKSLKEQANQRGRLAVLALVRAAQERDTEADDALKQSLALLARISKTAAPWQCWPEYVAATGVMNRPQLQASALKILEEMTKQAEARGTGPLNMEWARRVRHARTQAQILAMAPEQRSRVSPNPNSPLWSAVTHSRAQTRGAGYPPAQWLLQEGLARHYPGHAEDYLYLRLPLRGNFEVRGELTVFNRRNAHLGYGGLRLELSPNRKSYKLQSFSGPGRTSVLEPPLGELGESYTYRLVVQEGVLGTGPAGRAVWTAYVNDRKIVTEALSEWSDPWLVLHAPAESLATFRNLQLLGRPTIPESLSLGSGPDLASWYSYYANQNTWEKHGEEITSPGGRPDSPPNRQARSPQERALYYHRPLLEDGVIEYEFYYEPDKVLGHPALDRLAFLLHPAGVQVHWVTDGLNDRTALTRDNGTSEPKNRRGPARLPLQPRAWNRLKLTLKGDTVTLDLNGQEIYQRALEATNQRNFGFFHYADETSVRVRNVTYRGQWPRQLPEERMLLR